MHDYMNTFMCYNKITMRHINSNVYTQEISRKYTYFFKKLTFMCTFVFNNIPAKNYNKNNPKTSHNSLRYHK